MCRSIHFRDEDTKGTEDDLSVPARERMGYLVVHPSVDTVTVVLFFSTGEESRSIRFLPPLTKYKELHREDTSRMGDYTLEKGVVSPTNSSCRHNKVVYSDTPTQSKVRGGHRGPVGYDLDWTTDH